jgi:hypothetical protein
MQEKSQNPIKIHNLPSLLHRYTSFKDVVLKKLIKTKSLLAIRLWRYLSFCRCPIPLLLERERERESIEEVVRIDLLL